MIFTILNASVLKSEKENSGSNPSHTKDVIKEIHCLKQMQLKPSTMYSISPSDKGNTI